MIAATLVVDENKWRLYDAKKLSISADEEGWVRGFDPVALMEHSYFICQTVFMENPSDQEELIELVPGLEQHILRIAFQEKSWKPFQEHLDRMK